MTENENSNRIIGCAVEVHKALEPGGLLESAYQECLNHKLITEGLWVEKEKKCQ
jgi:GxxExxY protein